MTVEKTSSGGYVDPNCYRGHKVVAMPRTDLEGVVVNESVSTSTPNYPRPTIPTYPRSRSSSRGAASRSRDIVQEVYDRMGVSYERGRPSVDLPSTKQEGQEMLRAAGGGAVPSRGRSTTRYGGSVEPDKNRGRSLSQSKSFKWPPGEPEDPTMSPPIKTVSTRASMPASVGRDRGVGGAPSTNETRDDHEVDVPDDERDLCSVISMKSRISAYGTSTTKSVGGAVRTAVQRNKTPTPPSVKREFPPKINIYEDSSGYKMSDIQRKNEAATEDFTDPIPIATAPATQRFSSANSAAKSSKSSGLADAFLASIGPKNQSRNINTVAKQVPIIEIRADDQAGGDALSIAASSVSGDDFFASSSPRKKPYNKVTTYAKSSSSQAKNEALEKMVDDRVHAQMAIATKKFEVELHRIETIMEREYNSRLEALEMKTDRLIEVVMKE